MPRVGEFTTGRSEHAVLFGSKTLPDGTMRGSYHPPGASDDSVLESAASQTLTPKDVHPGYGAEHIPTEMPFAASTDEDAPFGRREFPRSSWGYTDVSKLVEGGRAHMNAMRKDPTFFEEYSAGTDFGDNDVRAEPYRFDELERVSTTDRDGWGLEAWWTPDEEQVVGLDVDESAVLGERARSIVGAGTNVAFSGHGYGKRAAMEYAVEQNERGFPVHGNSFTPAGAANFHKRGALSDDDLSYLVDDQDERWARELATDELTFMPGEDLAHRVSASYDEDTDRFTNRYGEVQDRDAVVTSALDAGVADDYRSHLTRSYAQESVAKGLLGKQKELLEPMLPYLRGGRDRSTQYRESAYQPSFDQPAEAGDRVPLGPTVGNRKRRQLVANGTLNPDHSVNEYLQAAR